MDKKETLKIMAILKATYPSYYKDGDFNAAAELWTEMFRDDGYPIVCAAVKSFIATDTKGFPPVIGQIKAMIQKLLEPEVMTEIEAWSYIKKAIRNSSYNALEEHSKLPSILQEIISPDQLRDWALADIADESVISSNFMRSYKIKAKRKEELSALPNEIKNLIGTHTKMLE